MISAAPRDALQPEVNESSLDGEAWLPANVPYVTWSSFSGVSARAHPQISSSKTSSPDGKKKHTLSRIHENIDWVLTVILSVFALFGELTTLSLSEFYQRLLQRIFSALRPRPTL